MKSITSTLHQWLSSQQTIGFLVSVVVMAVVSLAFFYPDNFEHNDLRQHDMVQGLANSHEIDQYKAETGVQSMWTGSLFSGMPAFQIAPKYSSATWYQWVTKVYGLGLPSPSNLLFMMMLGFMILMMALGIRWYWGLIGAIAWGLSSYFVIIIGAGHIWKFVTLAYIPPTIAGIIVAYRGRCIAGGALAAFFTMMQVASNHVQMTYYFGFLIAAIIVAFLIKALKRKELKRWSLATATLLVAAAAGLLANLPNLYHTNRYAKETMRGEGTVEMATEADGGLSREYITQYSYGRAETLSLLIPNVKGGATIKPVNGAPALLPMTEVAANTDTYLDSTSRMVMSQIPQYFGEPEMTNGPVYVGAIIVMLFLLGCIVVKGPLKWALLTATLLSILLAWGRNFMGLTDLFIDIVPMYSKFRTPESILVVAQFCMPLLGILGLVKWIKTAREKAGLKSLYIAAGITAFLCLIAVAVPSIYGVEDDLSRKLINAPGYEKIYLNLISLRESMVRADALRSLLFIVAGAAAMWLFAKGKLKRSFYVAAILGVLVAADLYTADKRYLSHESFVATDGRAPSIEPTAADNVILRDKNPNYRVLDLDRFAQAEPSYFHKTLGGYHAAKLGRYQDLIDRHITRLQSETDFDVINMLNARYIVNQGQVMENPDAMGNAWFVDSLKITSSRLDELNGLADVDLRHQAVIDAEQAQLLGVDANLSPIGDSDEITLTSYAPDRLTYQASSTRGGLAVLSEVWFPWGWKAYIDGKETPVGRVNYLLRAVNIPAGNHSVELVFAPETVNSTVAVAKAAISLIYIWVLVAVALDFIRRRKQEN